MKYLVWWTDQEESESVTDEQIAALPIYIIHQFESRFGRNGRGRLWVAEHIPVVEIPWLTNKPASRLADVRGGVVIDAEDAPAVFNLPGFLTDLELNFINEVPS